MDKKKVFRWLACFLLFFFCLGFWSLASAQEAVLKGQVKDEAGLPLKGARIILLDIKSGNKFTIKTGKDGKFFKVGLPSSQYRLAVESDGYQTYERELAVNYGGEYDLDVTLRKILPNIDQDRDFLEGVAFFKEGNYAQAVTSFEKVLKKYPENPVIYYNLGISTIRNGQKDEGLAYLEKASSLSPKMSEVYIALAEVYFSEGDSGKARKAAEEAINLEPANPKGYYNLGLILYKSGQMDEALASFITATKLDPGFSSAYYQAGLAYVVKSQFKEAIGCFEKFLEIEPQAPEAGRVKSMIEDLKKQIKES